MVFEKMENNNSSGESESESDFKAEVSYFFTPIKSRLGLGPRKNAIKVYRYLSRIVIDKYSTGIIWFYVFS
jgi:hypothetical protein